MSEKIKLCGSRESLTCTELGAALPLGISLWFGWQMETIRSCPLSMLADFNTVPRNMSPLQISPLPRPALCAARSGGSSTSAALTAAAGRREGEQSWKWPGTFIDPGLTQLRNVFLWDLYGVWEWEPSAQSTGPPNLTFWPGSKGRLSEAGWPLPIGFPWGKGDLGCSI